MKWYCFQSSRRVKVRQDCMNLDDKSMLFLDAMKNVQRCFTDDPLASSMTNVRRSVSFTLQHPHRIYIILQIAGGNCNAKGCWTVMYRNARRAWITHASMARMHKWCSVFIQATAWFAHDGAVVKASCQCIAASMARGSWRVSTARYLHGGSGHRAHERHGQSKKTGAPRSFSISRRILT